MSILEKALERRCCYYAEADGGMQFKVQGSRGMPDRCFIRPHGAVFFVEFKRSGLKPSELQDYYLRLLKTKRVEAYWVTCFTQFRRIWHETK